MSGKSRAFLLRNHERGSRGEVWCSVESFPCFDTSMADEANVQNDMGRTRRLIMTEKTYSAFLFLKRECVCGGGSFFQSVFSVLARSCFLLSRRVTQMNHNENFVIIDTWSNISLGLPRSARVTCLPFNRRIYNISATRVSGHHVVMPLTMIV